MFVITGAAGFIGSHLVAKLNRLGHTNLILVDSLGSMGKWQNLQTANATRFLHSDEFIKLFSSEHFKEVKAIFHLGACSDTTETNADFLIQNNTNYSITLAEHCKKYHIPFIYASSAATYGNGDKGYSDKHEEIFKLSPLNAYGFSKHLFDMWVLNENKNFPWYGLKFFNVYGANEGFKGFMASKVWQGYHEIQSNGSIKLFKSDRDSIKDGQQKRDFIFVEDVVDVMWDIYQNHSKIQPQILNLGTGKARTFYDLANALFKACQINEKIEWLEMPQKLVGKYQYFTQADMTKFQNIPELKREFTTLEDGVAKTVEVLRSR